MSEEILSKLNEISKRLDALETGEQKEVEYSPKKKKGFPAGLKAKYSALLSAQEDDDE